MSSLPLLAGHQGQFPGAQLSPGVSLVPELFPLTCQKGVVSPSSVRTGFGGKRCRSQVPDDSLWNHLPLIERGLCLG